MSTASEDAYWAAVRSDLMVFLRHAFTFIYPGKDFMPNWHIDAIVNCLEQSIVGEMPRLVINLPPWHLKSFVISVVLPAFTLGLDPSAKFICISYSDELAKIPSRDFRRIVESAWYRRLFPQVKFTKATEGEFVTDKGGFRLSTSVGGTLTGRGSDFIIIDDPIKPEDAYSDRTRDGVNTWYRSTVLSRLDDKQHSVLILVMQRLHVNDPCGYIEAAGDYHKLSLPAIAIKDELIALRGGQHFRRREGEALHEQREGIKLPHKIRAEIGTFNYMCNSVSQAVTAALNQRRVLGG
jgi:hypothetical protein